MLYAVRIYCPVDLQPFLVTIEAPSKEEAVKKVIGTTEVCPAAHEFTVEEYFIIGAYPSPEGIPRPPYKVAELNSVTPPKWSLGATLVEEVPPPIGVEPVGSPYLKKVIPDSLTTFIYEQEIRSKEYPDYVGHIQFRRDIFTKFLEEAKRMRKADKISESILYIITYTPGITIRMIADVLDIGYWTAWREVAKLARPTEEELKEIMKYLDETASLEKWTAPQKEEIVLSIKTPKEPKVSIGPLWRGERTLYPIRRKTEDELLKEIERIFTLERYFPTPQEWEKTKQAMRKQTEAWMRQSIEYYLQK
jgi:hypothetical protein